MTSSRSLYRLGFLVALLLLTGVSCPVFKAENPAQPAEGVILTQGRPPEDCGQRNPRKIKAYFTIPRAEIRLGDTMYLDATCTVGRIAEVKWTFDFESFPENTPGEERFEQTLRVDYWDLYDTERAYKPYPLNNLSPFLQTFTPATPGTHTARLWVKDHRGETQLVIHTYIVHPSPSAATTQSLRPFFTAQIQAYPAKPGLRSSIPLPHMVNDVQPIVLPWPPGLRLEKFLPPLLPDSAVLYQTKYHEQPSFYGGTLQFLPVGTAGEVDTYRWDVRGISANPQVGALTLVSTPYTRSEFNAESGLLVPPLEVRLKAPIFPRLVDERLYPGPQLQESAQVVPGANFPYDVKAELLVKNSFGNEQTYRQTYRFVDSFINDSLFPQLAVLPLDPEGKVKIAPEAETTLTPGQLFRLQSVSLLLSHRFRGNTTVEFDPGTGVWDMVATIPQPQYRTNDEHAEAFRNDPARVPSNWQEHINPLNLTNKNYNAPTIPGAYTAKIRLTDIAPNGIRAAPSFVGPRESREARVTFTVAGPPPFAMALAARPTGAVVGEQVVFDASGSTGDIESYRWRVVDLQFDETLHNAVKDDNLPTQFSFRFSRPGRYRVSVEGKARGGDATKEATLDYNVQAQPSAGRGRLPEITISGVFPSKPGTIEVRSILYEDDALLFGLLGITTAVDLIEWDFDRDGTVDDRCRVEEQLPDPRIFSRCSVREKAAPQRAGEYTARVLIYERGGTGRQTQEVRYTVTAGNSPAARRPQVFTPPQ